LSPPDSSSIFFIQSYISPFAISQGTVQKVEDMVSNEVEELVMEQCRAMLSKSGLENVLRQFQTHQKPLAETIQLSRELLISSFEALDLFLLDLTMDLSDKLYRITSVEIAKRVSIRGSQHFLHDYRFLVDQISDPENKFGDPMLIVRRSVQEVETLLALHEDS
jgi:hypothetical protein